MERISVNRKEETYNLDFDGRITGEHKGKFRKLIEKHQLNSNFIGLLKKPHNLVTSDSYGEYKTLLWILYETLETFSIRILFIEDCVPEGCKFRSNADFCVDENGNFKFEFKNQLVIHETLELSADCREQLKEKSETYEKDSKITGNIRGIDFRTFLERTTRI